jgi:hypothetical protein
LTSLRCRPQPFWSSVGEAARIPPWPQRKRCLPPPLTHRTGIYGITWECMGVNGRRRDEHPNRRETGT